MVRPPLLPMLAVVAGVLGMVAQIALPARTPLPEIGPSVARALPRRAAAIEPAFASPLIGARTLFSPSRLPDAPVLAAGPGGAVADPFAGVVLVGTARSHNFAVALVRQPSGAVVSLRPGAALGHWRLIGVGRASASFASAGVVRSLRVGETAKVQPIAGQETPEVPPS